MGKVKIAELPKPLKSKWTDEQEAKRLAEEREREIKDGTKASAEADRVLTGNALRTVRVIDGKLVPLSSFVEVKGRAEKHVQGGLLLREPRYERIRPDERSALLGPPGAELITRNARFKGKALTPSSAMLQQSRPASMCRFGRTT